MTSQPSRLWGSFAKKTGFNRQSDEPPGACSVEDPSKHHIGQSSSLPENFLSIFVLLRKLWTGWYPSSQMYSNLAIDIAGGLNVSEYVNRTRSFTPNRLLKG